MPDLKSLDSLYLVLAFIVPGLIASFIRIQFTTGRAPSHSEAMLSYFTLSIIYYALALPVVEYILTLPETGRGRIIAWFLLVLVGPAAFGALLGVNAQLGLLRRFLRWCRLNPVHVMPTAWDWKSSTMRESWVLVVLKDGTRFGGFCGTNSFFSTDPKERDLYIERVYDIDENEQWSPRENSVLIAGGEIRTIEFWPYRKEENSEQGQVAAANTTALTGPLRQGVSAPTDLSIVAGEAKRGQSADHGARSSVEPT
nr:DUF6338 family protein [Rhodoplanes tepidamans]